MIYTVTLNPAVDYYMTMDEFKQGELNTINEGYTMAGGKGINVSKVLKNCGITSTALGFLGGFTGYFIRNDIKNHGMIHEMEILTGFTGDYLKTSVEHYGITDKFVEISEKTRINIKIKTDEIESEIAGIAPNIKKKEYEAFLKTLETIKKGDTLVLSGSVPKTLSEMIYKEIIEKVPEGVKIILDTRGQAFIHALGEKIFLVKPNQNEVGEFFGEKYETLDELIAAGKKLQKMGAENVIISRGKDGSILLTKDEVYIGNVPNGKLVSSVGSGDSMIAGLIYGLEHDLSVTDSYKYAIAAGSATAFKQGLANIDDIKALLKDIKIEKK